jgi:acyl carrier protein
VAKGTVADRVRHVIGKQLYRPAAEITDKLSLRDDLKIDSLDVVETMIALETEFDVRIEDDDFNPRTVGDIIAHMEKKHG